MGGAIEQQFVAAWTRVQAQRDLVAHGSAGQEEARLMAEQLRHAVLQGQSRRVQPPLLVANHRTRDRRPHPIRRARLRVAIEIDRRQLGAEPTAGRRSVQLKPSADDPEALDQPLHVVARVVHGEGRPRRRVHP